MTTAARTLALGALCSTFALAACGGGGGSSPSTPSGSSTSVSTNGGQTSTPTPTPTSSVSATPTPTPVPGSSATPTPPTATTTTTVVADSNAAPVTLTLAPNQVIGTPPPTIKWAETSSAPINGIPCRNASTDNHFHVHVSIFSNGSQQAVPTAIGLYNPVLYQSPYYWEINYNDPTTCFFELHTHVPNGVFHVSLPGVRPYTLGDLFDVWGVTPTPIGFWSFSGATRVFVTNESAGTAGNYPVTEITGIDPHTVVLHDRYEYTIEVGTPVNIPNYVFGSTL